MRLVQLLFLVAALGSAGLASILTAGPAWAQTVTVGEGARVGGAVGSRVNVRAQPVVESGNVVTQTTGGTLVRVLEAAERGDHVWYRVANLPDAASSFEGWIRGDLLTPAALPERTVGEVLAETSEAAPRADTDAMRRVPFAERTDWSRNLLELYPAIEACARVSSAPPVTMLRATTRTRNRDLAEVVTSDSAGRRWSCVIDVRGGTPVRYDPVSATLFLRDRLASEPFFSIEAERPALDPDCYRFEQVTRPEDGTHLGWLYYRTCP